MQLQQEVASMKSNEFIVEIATKVAVLHPNETIEKAAKEVLEALTDAIPELVCLIYSRCLQFTGGRV
jgi:hypothetical protein